MILTETQKSQVDWLTLTVRSPEARERLSILASGVLEAEIEAGRKPYLWRWKGYDGFAGKYFSYGSRAQDDISILKGAVADENWWQFARLARNVSRVDLAVTCKLKSPDESIAKNAWVAIQELSEKRGLGREYTFIQGLNGGSTLYVGKRASAEYGRLYDKSAQLAEPPFGLKWRYEVEIKKPRALGVAKSLTVIDVASMALCNYVRDWFGFRYVVPIFGCSEVSILLEREMNLSSVDITLNWLQSQVRPAILRLIEAGHAKRVEEALQLPLFPYRG